MLIVEGQGLPLGVRVESAQKAEVRLAEAALAHVKVPRRVGRPRTRPREVVATGAMTVRPSAEGCEPEASSRVFPGGGTPGPGRGGSRTFQATGRGGWWRGPSPGWGAFGGWW